MNNTMNNTMNHTMMNHTIMNHTFSSIVPSEWMCTVSDVENTVVSNVSDVTSNVTSNVTEIPPTFLPDRQLVFALDQSAAILFFVLLIIGFGVTWWKVWTLHKQVQRLVADEVKRDKDIDMFCTKMTDMLHNGTLEVNHEKVEALEQQKQLQLHLGRIRGLDINLQSKLIPEAAGTVAKYGFKAVKWMMGR
ncbi:hypothetical protein OAM67_00360 [bacterium]|nr:hypothetical protein [bacterium]